MYLRAWAEVDLSAIRHNVATLRDLVGPETRVMAIVKANAYGHGLVPCARAAVEAGAACLGVAAVDEGVRLRVELADTPICLFAPFLPAEADAIVEHGITPFVSSLEQARMLADSARRQGRIAEGHLEIDTGMGRSGFHPDALPGELPSLIGPSGPRITGIATHFPCAESDRPFTEMQTATLRRVQAVLAGRGMRIPLAHAANSAATLLNSGSRMDMIRPGLLLYGVFPALPEGFPRPDVRPALAFKARVALVRDMPAGHGISYGQTCRLARPSRVATIPVGYGDGYPRALSGLGSALIRGRRAAILGRVCMDVLMADVTEIPGVEVGEEVVLIGAQREERIRVEELAASADTTEHDITTRLTDRVPRVYVGG